MPSWTARLRPLRTIAEQSAQPSLLTVDDAAHRIRHQGNQIELSEASNPALRWESRQQAYTQLQDEGGIAELPFLEQEQRLVRQKAMAQLSDSKHQESFTFLEPDESALRVSEIRATRSPVAPLTTLARLV